MVSVNINFPYITFVRGFKDLHSNKLTLIFLKHFNTTHQVSTTSAKIPSIKSLDEYSRQDNSLEESQDKIILDECSRQDNSIEQIDIQDNYI